MNRSIVEAHRDRLVTALEEFSPAVPALERWGRDLARRLSAGSGLLLAGNGGSSSLADHAVAELVGGIERDRRPLKAINLFSAAVTLTALANDFGYERSAERLVAALAGPGDVLLCISVSGESRNLLAAVSGARRCGVTAWALVGHAPCSLSAAVDEFVALGTQNATTTQELHLVALHALCLAVDESL